MAFPAAGLLAARHAGQGLLGGGAKGMLQNAAVSEDDGRAGKPGPELPLCSSRPISLRSSAMCQPIGWPAWDRWLSAQQTHSGTVAQPQPSGISGQLVLPFPSSGV